MKDQGAGEEIVAGLGSSRHKTPRDVLGEDRGSNVNEAAVDAA